MDNNLNNTDNTQNRTAKKASGNKKSKSNGVEMAKKVGKILLKVGAFVGTFLLQLLLFWQ